MPAYILVEVQVHDPATYEDYKKLVPSSLEPYGGQFIIRGGKTETLEGSWSPARMVMLEFESVEQAKQWWASPEYAEAKAMRQRAAKTEMIVVEGV